MALRIRAGMFLSSEASVWSRTPNGSALGREACGFFRFRVRRFLLPPEVVRVPMCDSSLVPSAVAFSFKAERDL